MMKVKICGITNLDDALAAINFGANALGFVFFKESPRYIEPAKAKEIISKLPPFITTVGVFVDEPRPKVEKILKLTGLDAAQFHGQESPEDCAISKKAIKGIRVKDLSNLDPIKNFRYKVSAFLLDAYTPDAMGGTGTIFNWDIAVEAKQYGNIILAGGLNHDNIEKAIRWVRPYGVDVSSGVESEKGKKDHLKMAAFISKAKAFIR